MAITVPCRSVDTAAAIAKALILYVPHNSGSYNVWSYYSEGYQRLFWLYTVLPDIREYSVQLDTNEKVSDLYCVLHLYSDVSDLYCICTLMIIRVLHTYSLSTERTVCSTELYNFCPNKTGSLNQKI